MGRVLITGSSAGLGLMAGQRLLADGHQVVLHARNEERAHDARAAALSASAVVIGDLSSIAETREVAEQANRLGPFDAVIHNAGWALASAASRRSTASGTFSPSTFSRRISSLR
jgi:NAD(P)-dependent dehydrogenase (short-subunit alcohol dehydrogenase family)